MWQDRVSNPGLLAHESDALSTTLCGQFLFSAYCLIMLYICIKFHENMVYRFKVMKQTLFPY